MYHVACPTARRADTIATRTLGTLAHGGVPMDRVTLFIPDKAEADNYRAVIRQYGCRVRWGHGWGAPAMRRAIARAYPAGTELMCFDDDVDAVARCYDSRTLTDLDPGELVDVLGHCFDTAGTRLWGVYPVANPFFMHPARVRRGRLWPIIGTMFGYVVTGDDIELPTVDDKDDYERSIKFYLRDGEVVRFDNLTFRTKYMTTAGGMSGDRAALSDRAARQIAASYPAYATYYRRKNGRSEVRLRTAPVQTVATRRASAL